MINTFNRDRYFIERKYHIPEEPFNGYLRWNHHGYPFDEKTGLSDDEIQKELASLHKKLKNEPHSIQKAKYFALVLDNTRIDINEHDYFIGMWTWNRPLLKYTCDIWNTENFSKFPKAEKVFSTYNKTGGVMGWLDYDHTIPDWDSLLALGFSGILQRLHYKFNSLINNSGLTDKQRNFYEACVIEYQAIIRFIDRLYNNALKQTHEKAQSYAICLKHLRDGAPTDTYEAMQLIYIYFMLSEHIDNYQVRSLGFGLDASLYPFFEKDIKSGKYAKNDIKQLLSYFLMQWSSINSIMGHPFYLGGRDKNGNCKVNELSYLILETIDELNIISPKVQIKVSDNTPKDFILKALKMIQKGKTNIVFVHDEMIVKCLMSTGSTYEEALDSAISGCYEYKTKNNVIDISLCYFNLLICVSLVFDNGLDRFSNTQIGIKTGEVSEFASFKDFYSAFLKQIKFITERYLDATELLEKDIAEINPSLMFSSTIESCVNTMTDAIDGGIKNVSQVLLSSLGSTVDAIMAVYELVYENKVTTLSILKDALNKNWEGYEILRLKALNCKHKYGCGDKLADYYAGAILQYFYNIIASRKNGHGDEYKLELHSAYTFVWLGEKTMATPDGRKFGDETSKNASPHPGADKKGVTELIRSSTSFNTVLANEGMCLDVMLHPTTVKDEDGLNVLYNVMRTYMDKGGQSIHFNIFNPDILRDAQINPEKYQNLQVRVCGWNSLWNNLSKAEQDAYIVRADNIRE